MNPFRQPFPLLTTVTCTVADATHRTDTCSFSVTVVPPLSPPRLGAMSFLVFGDSITEGKTARSSLHNLTLEGCNGVPLPGNYANDLNVDPRNTASIGLVVDALRSMIRCARERNVTVFIGTLLPERLHGTPPRGDAAASIPLANLSIHSMAENEGAIVVDLYQAFGTMPDPTFIDIDGLHPTAAGHDLIAKSFFESVRARLDIVSQSR